ASVSSGNWYYDRHCSVRLVIYFDLAIFFDLAIDQIAQSRLSSLNVIYYSAQLFRESKQPQYGSAYRGPIGILSTQSG
ncbi:hypothetical protein ACONIB_003488, partial [Edwardsiella ictaluri]